jgi:hypothetical protein
MNQYEIALPFAESYHPDTGYEQDYGIMLTDGETDNIMPGALSYLRRRFKVGTMEAKAQDVHVALGDRVNRYLSGGLAGHYRTYKITNGASYKQTNADIGVMVTPFSTVGFGAVAYNVLKAKDSIPVGVRDVPTFAVGMNWMYEETFAFRLDIVHQDKFNPRHRNDVHLGAQTKFQEAYFLRIGTIWKETMDQTLLTAGVGYAGPRLSVNYAYEYDERMADNRRHIVDLWLPF